MYHAQHLRKQAAVPARGEAGRAGGLARRRIDGVVTRARAAQRDEIVAAHFDSVLVQLFQQLDFSNKLQTMIFVFSKVLNPLYCYTLV